MNSLLFVSFLAGLLTILSPCVLSLLPIILAGSIGEDSKWHPYIVTASLAISIVVFTVLLKVSSILLGIPPGIWTYVSGGIVLFLGLTYLFPHAWSRISVGAGSSAFQESLGKTTNIQSGLPRAILTGVALGPVFSSCSPTYSLLLATVFPVSLLHGIGYIFVYAIGLSLMLLLIGRGGQKVIKRVRPLADEKGWFRKILGVILVVVALALFSGIDKKIEVKLLSGFNVNTIEQGILERLLPTTYQAGNPVADTTNPTLALPGTENAPWVELSGWINSKPLTLESLKGKVVIVDFWTYSCINCQRTLPYLVALDKKYRDKGLVIIGAHAPEFAFEKQRANVEQAVKDAGIEYPVVLDNDFDLWRAYENRYWPAKYFIDKKGKLRHFHFWEGGYEETEKVIQLLLAEDGGEIISGILSKIPEKASVSEQSPETYLGTARRENKVDSSKKLGANEWSIEGEWREQEESIASVSGAKLSYSYSARDVYLVLAGQGTVKVSVDGKLVDTIGWRDVKWGMVNVSEDRMYHLVHEEAFRTGKTLELEFSPGVQAFAFTFGG